MSVRSIWQCKHERKKIGQSSQVSGPVLHATVGKFLPTKEAQGQGRVRACRGDSHSFNNHFLMFSTPCSPSKYP